MIALYDQIQELLAELRDCDMTPDERAQARAEVARARIAQAELDYAFEAQFQAGR
jgi:hypothetical protein